MYTLEQTKNIWVTSDHHFGHQNIIKYCNRPFNTVDEMDDELIYEWNSVVGNDDLVYHLGDLTLGDDAAKYLEQLNGIISILYNPEHHDKRWIKRNDNIYANICNSKSEYEVQFANTITTLKINIGQEYPFIVDLCHFPLSSWHGSFHGSLLCYGHLHQHSIDVPNTINVGIDQHPQFQPFNIYTLLSNKEYI